MQSGEQAQTADFGLTERQRAVMDLVIQHMTSKDVGRLLDISASTVDQHIKAVGIKLGAHNRKSAARAYAALKAIPGKTTPDSSQVAQPEQLAVADASEPTVAPVFTLRDASGFDGEWSSEPPPPDPGEVVISGRLARLLTILAIALGLALLGAAMIAIMNGLNQLI